MKGKKERDYILGTHDDEISRLGLQHRVWRPRASLAWRRAGFSSGQTIIDLGCGPGYASVDLAGIVGPEGRVVAIDRSRRFLDYLESTAEARGLGNIAVHEMDLDEGDLPSIQADGAWARWVFAFVKNPRGLLARLAERLRPGAAVVIHEYFDYSTWRTAPRCRELEEFVRLVMESWRQAGGEPDIALDIPTWLGDLNFEILATKPIVEVVPRSSFVWEWPRSFIQVGLERLQSLGLVTPERADVIREVCVAIEEVPGALMITPGVLEIVAVKRQLR
jgi:SAM-dependent methyltransferase